LFNFNSLLEKDSKNSQKMSEILDVPKSCFSENFQECIHYAFKDDLFMTPEGSWQELLNKEEINFIEKYSSPIIELCGLDMDIKNPEKNSKLDDEEFKNTYEKMLALCNDNPNIAKNFIDSSIYCPMQFQKNIYSRWINEAKRLARLVIKH
jgi:hypothetical protein